MRLFLALCPALMLIPYEGVIANGWENLVALDARVIAMTGAAVGQAGGPSAPIDPRIRLAQCPQAASIEQAGNDAVAIRCAALGWRIRVPLVARAKSNAESSPILVRRGDIVELVYEGAGFAATSSGTVLDDGPLGKMVRVKTSTSGVPVAAIVAAAGTVHIPR
jgi:flagellar basal body P-ring formation protein FlgA